MKSKLFIKTILLILIGTFVFAGIGLVGVQASSCEESDSTCSDFDGYISVNDERSGCLNANDWKYYKVSEAAGKTLKVRVEWSGTGCNKNDFYIYKSNCDQIVFKENNSWVKSWEGYTSSDIIIGLDGDSSNNNCQWDLSVTRLSGTSQTEGVDLRVYKSVKNLSQGDMAWHESQYANPGDKLMFRIEVKSAGDEKARNVMVKSTLASGIVYQGNLIINNVYDSRNIINGINIGDLSSGQSKFITFEAEVAYQNGFTYSSNNLINTVLAYNSEDSISDSCRIVLLGTGTTGATVVSTGLTDNVFLDSFFLPLLISVFLVWLFRSKIINFGRWADLRKEGYNDYKSKKMLQLKIAKIKAKDLIKKKIS